MNFSEQYSHCGCGKLLDLLRQAFSARNRNLKIARDINEGEKIGCIAQKYGIKPVKSDLQIKFEQRWWLEKLFDRVNLTYVQGVLLIYVFAVGFRLVFLPHILLSKEEAFKIGFFASFIGDMVIIIALLFIHIIQKGLIRLMKQVNDYLKNDKYVAPLVLIESEKDIISEARLRKLDESYQDVYIKPVFCKTLQYGLDLAFDKNYQLGSGIIATSLVLIIFILRFPFKVLPPTVFALWIPVPEIAIPYQIYAYFMISSLWFMVGVLTWTLLVVFLIIIQVSGNTIRFRPFESIREYFKPIMTLALKNSFTTAALVSWFCPYMLVWTAFPHDPAVRESAINFIRSSVVIMTPIIVLSLLLPILKIHRGMDITRDRALLLKLLQLEKLKKHPLSDFDRHLKIQQHLTEDYRAISKNSEWPIDMGQTAQVIISTFLPAMTLFVTQLLGYS